VNPPSPIEDAPLNGFEVVLTDPAAELTVPLPDNVGLLVMRLLPTPLVVDKGVLSGVDPDARLDDNGAPIESGPAVERTALTLPMAVAWNE